MFDTTQLVQVDCSSGERTWQEDGKTEIVQRDEVINNRKNIFTIWGSTRQDKDSKDCSRITNHVVAYFLGVIFEHAFIFFKVHLQYLRHDITNVPIGCN